MANQITTPGGAGAGVGTQNNYPGQFCPHTQGVSNYGSLTLAANRAYFVRFVAIKTRTVTQMAFGVNAAATVNDNVDVGIYDSLLNRLGSSGSTAGKLNAGAGSVQFCPLTASVGLVADTTYYAALACGPVGGTAASVDATNDQGRLYRAFGSAAPNIGQCYADSAFPLPVGPVSPSLVIGGCAVLAVIE